MELEDCILEGAVLMIDGYQINEKAAQVKGFIRLGCWIQ